MFMVWIKYDYIDRIVFLRKRLHFFDIMEPQNQVK